MLHAMRCDHCDAILTDNRVERHRKRFCCSECARAFDEGELKAISPHRHDLEGQPPAGLNREPLGAR